MKQKQTTGKIESTCHVGFHLKGIRLKLKLDAFKTMLKQCRTWKQNRRVQNTLSLNTSQSTTMPCFLMLLMLHTEKWSDKEVSK